MSVLKLPLYDSGRWNQCNYHLGKFNNVVVVRPPRKIQVGNEKPPLISALQVLPWARTYSVTALHDESLDGMHRLHFDAEQSENQYSFLLKGGRRSKACMLELSVRWNLVFCLLITVAAMLQSHKGKDDTLQ